MLTLSISKYIVADIKITIFLGVSIYIKLRCKNICQARKKNSLYQARVRLINCSNENSSYTPLTVMIDISHSLFGHFPVISQSFPSHFPVISQLFPSYFPVISQSFVSHFSLNLENMQISIWVTLVCVL